MFIITSNKKILEVSDNIKYVLEQKNGVRVLCDKHSASLIYSVYTDVMYHLSSHKCYEVDESGIPLSNNICNEYEYDGENFIRSDVGDLKDLNKTLNAQVTLLSEQNTFLEECLLEMASEVYK